MRALVTTFSVIAAAVASAATAASVATTASAAAAANVAAVADAPAAPNAPAAAAAPDSTRPRPSATTEAPPEPPGYWAGPINSPVPATLNGGVVISDVHRVQALQKDKNAVVIDVSNAPLRPDNMAPGAPWLPLPHQAIPGSLWIPGVGLGEVSPAVSDFFRAQLAAATGNDPARPLVIYCHQTCWLSWNAAKRAISYDYRHVYWYRDGIEGWKAAHLPTAVVEPRVAPEP